MARISQKPGQVTAKQAFKDFFKGYVDFKGRTTRAGYWWVYLIIYGINIVVMIGMLALVFGTLFSMFANSEYLFYENSSPRDMFLGQFVAVYFLIYILFIVYNLAIALPTLALTIRRYRDTGLRGRGTLVIWLCYPVLFLLSFLSPIPLLFPLILQFNLFFFAVTVMPTDFLTITTDNEFLAFFFRGKSSLETGNDELDF